MVGVPVVYVFLTVPRNDYQIESWSFRQNPFIFA